MQNWDWVKMHSDSQRNDFIRNPKWTLLLTFTVSVKILHRTQALFHATMGQSAHIFWANLVFHFDKTVLLHFKRFWTVEVRYCHIWHCRSRIHHDAGFQSSPMSSPFISASPSTVQHFHHRALKSSTLPRPFSSSSHPSQHFTPLFYPFFPIHIRSNTHTQKKFQREAQTPERYEESERKRIFSNFANFSAQ